ncbi:MAG: putative cell division FtsK/SpoIIIE [Candidatus Doudnabacteria bacterium]|nr:putative cell division FtsK/SpoIIIE [Candidatus Doudnabacteria bacterium]
MPGPFFMVKYFYMARSKKQKTQHLIPKPTLNLGAETKKGVAVIFFVALFLIASLSLFDKAGIVGQYINEALRLGFGLIAYFIPIIFLLVGISLYKQTIKEEESQHFYFRTYIGAFLLAGAFAGLLHVFYMKDGTLALDLVSQKTAGGYLGALFGYPFFALTGFWAALIILFGLMIIGLLVTFDVSLSALMPQRKTKEEQAKKEGQVNYDVGPIKINGMAKTGFISEKVQEKNKALDIEPKKEKIPEASPINKGVDDKKSDLLAIQLDDRKDWKLPPFDLLEDTKNTVDSGNIEVNVSIIQKTLADFGIEVEMGEVNVGPTVTQYTLRPAQGVKLSQIAGLQNDLALALSAQSIRMELPIPGKALVGIEIPNKTSAMVRLREVLQTENFVKHPSKLAFALGRDVSGHPMVGDLARMPHLMIAGSTGSGKSVALNSFLISLLYKNTPQDVKLIVIDPKRVEMTPYNGIPHLLTPVVTDHEKAVNALKWAVAEMDRRYKVLAEAGNRNIADYNNAGGLKMHYIVIIVDELADLMAVAKNDVEATIVRLSQMARAVGIHLVLATQRPSVEVITGLIKANITSRIAFAVASQVDSRTILDSSGAESLLGNGDMLFITADIQKPRRIQGAYVGEKEVNKVAEYFKKQTGAVIYNDEILERPKHPMSIPGFSSGGDDEDEMLKEAENVVREAGKASASLLQRRLRIGYARAARMLDLLEDRGIIGPGDGAKPREVYISSDMGSVADEEYQQANERDI